MPVQPRTSSKKDRRRESQKPILAAAEKVFSEAGFGRARIRLVAYLTGLPKTNLHHYFAIKEALYRHVVENIVRIWLQATGIFHRNRCAGQGSRHRNLSPCWTKRICQARVTLQPGRRVEWTT